MSRSTLRDSLRYRFDNFMARGGSSIFLSLVVVFLALLAVLGLARGLVNLVDPGAAERPGGFLHHLFQTFLHLMDPGTVAYDIDSSALYKTVSILSGLFGVVILSSLIAFITTALTQKLESLKKGHSRVIEEDHTLILGWSERIVEVLRELILANESEDDPVVVILSEVEKERMDDHLSIYLEDAKNTRIVTRSGNVASLANLEIAALASCKSVVVLARCGEDASSEAKAASDAKVVKTVLAIMAAKPPERAITVVAELFSRRDRDIVQGLAPGEIVTFDAQDIMAKLLVQTSRSTGLSVVYAELLSFDGCEMYFYDDGGWAGRRFGEAQFHFPDGVPIGVRTAEGELELNPPSTRELAADDELLVVAEDDSTLAYRPEPVATPRELPLAPGRLERRRERDLLIGWTPKAATIVREYADYVLEGSRVEVMLRGPDAAVRAEIETLDAELDEIEVVLVDRNPLDLDDLEAMEPFGYDNIIILSQGRTGVDAETTDSETLVILLLLRQIFAAHPEEAGRTRLVTEMLDSENRSLIAQAGVNDFIISNQLVSMMLAQVSESGDMKRVYDQLFEEGGSEIYLKPLSLYLEALPAELAFADLMALAQKRSEVAIGVKLRSGELSMAENFGVTLIPEKSTRFRLGADDCLVVLAEDET